MLEMFIEGGLILLLIYMPLAGGGIPEFSMALLELVSGLLVLLWLVQLFSQRKQASRRHRRSHRRTPSERASQEPYSIRFAIPAFTGLLILFVLLNVFQLCPLPGFQVNSLSPRTYHLYAEGAANTEGALPFFLPLSVYTRATEGELYRVL